MSPHAIETYSDSTSTGSESDQSVLDGFQDARHGELVAIVGMGCRLPGGVRSPDDLWDLLSEGRSGYKEFPSDRLNVDGFYHPNFARPGSFHTRGAYLLDEDPRNFDHAFFGINATSVLTMDPTQRKLLEVSYEALENAGQTLEKVSGSRTGVFVGNMNADYSLAQGYDADFSLPHASTGGSNSIISNRINHVFNLKGPSVTVDTACSSSMYALHAATQAILNDECTAAIVGGSNLILGPEMQMLTAKLGALSGTSACHTFDASADGYARGEGFGAIYLKKYSDAIRDNDAVRAVIRATAVNSNGRTAGISHPSADGQEAVMRQAYRKARLDASQTGYFECHGTGTPVGDPIEISAIGRVFSKGRLKPLPIGSVKTNLGHAEAASGIVGIMKTVLILEHGMIPPSIGVSQLNPNIDFHSANVKVITKMTPWPAGSLRRASVNSFGYGGANSHVILDHPSVLGGVRMPSRVDRTRRLVLLPFSGPNSATLSATVDDASQRLSNLSLKDVAYTLTNRRTTFPWRTHRIVETSESPTRAHIKEEAVHNGPQEACRNVAFIFTGQGAQWEKMGEQLLDYEVFANAIHQQDQVLQSLTFAPPWTIEGILTGRTALSINEPEVTQTVCTALQVGLTNLLRTWNITPSICVGHSSGEIAAAYASDVLSLADAIIVAYCRGKAVSTVAQEGAMIAVGLGNDEAAIALQGVEAQVKIAAINSPNSVTLSGDADAINRLAARLAEQDVFVRKVGTGGRAYHSHHMKEPGERYLNLLEKSRSDMKRVPLRSRSKLPSARWASTVHPDVHMEECAPSLAYWRQNLESPVQFAAAVECMARNDDSRPDLVIEIGPHCALKSPLKQIFARFSQAKPVQYLPTLVRHQDGMRNILDLCGSLFALDYPVDLMAVNAVAGSDSFGAVCTRLPPHQYDYGPPICFENRIAHQTKHRKYLRHDLLGVLQPGSAKNRPSWRNMLRVKDIPWLTDHQLLPHTVLPGAAYLCIAIEALSQFLGIGLKGNDRMPAFRLRNVSITTAMRIPEDELGLEIVTDLRVSSHSDKWFDFNIASVGLDGTAWTEHASGLVATDHDAHPSLGDIKSEMDPRIIDPDDWYETFTENGLGYGKTFQGISQLETDPQKNIASAMVDLATTRGLFNGPESRYLIHPASLDICFQVGLIACHGGHTGLMKHAFVPVAIEDMTVWPNNDQNEWCQCVAQTKPVGLRAAHARIQLDSPTGHPLVEITKIRSVSYTKDTASTTIKSTASSPYLRFAWKPDISFLASGQIHNMLSQRVDADSQNSYATMEFLLDLYRHRDPALHVLTVGHEETGIQTAVENIFASVSSVHDLEPSSSQHKFDLVVANLADGSPKLLATLFRDVAPHLKDNGSLVLLLKDVREIEKYDWNRELIAGGFSGRELELQSPQAGVVSCITSKWSMDVAPERDTLSVQQNIYILYLRECGPFHDTLASAIAALGHQPVVESIYNVSPPERSRIILTTDLEASVLVDHGAKDFYLLKSIIEGATSLLWITTGDILRGAEPKAAVVTGLIRMLTTENPASQYGVMHLETSYDCCNTVLATSIARREQLVFQGNMEREIAMCDGVEYIGRLVPDEAQNDRHHKLRSGAVEIVHESLKRKEPLEAAFETPGLLSSLYFRPITLSKDLPDDWIEIETAAIGLNWKDVAASASRIDSDTFSLDCAGIVTKAGKSVRNVCIGDRVYAIAPSRFNNRIRLPACHAQIIQLSQSPVEMATIPLVCCTALYALKFLAHLRKGERILIQSATGGVGIAAIQIARSIGAQIYATAGTSEKADFLCTTFGIEKEHIVVSRDAQALQKLGVTFNVVLSSASGDYMKETLRFLAPMGRFIDIGRVDAMNSGRMAMEAFQRNATFSSFDLSLMASQDPAFVGQLMQEVDGLVRLGVILPIKPIATFDVSELDKALLQFSKGKHIGKIVVDYNSSSSLVKISLPAPQAFFDPGAMYVLIGGLGGLGRSILQWMVGRGARNFTVITRSSTPSAVACRMIDELAHQNVTVRLESCDITSKQDLRRAFERSAKCGPIKGILHAAVVLQDRVFNQLTHEQWQGGLAAKIHGSYNLHDICAEMQLDLDFFIMTSSFEAVVALPTQAAYVAANCFQDAFARYRRARGLPATTIAFGLITEIGVMGQRSQVRDLIERNGFYRTGELEFLRLMEGALLNTEIQGRSEEWRYFDPLAAAQLTTCLDPSALAKVAAKSSGASILTPRWHSDAKFSHIFHAMQTQLAVKGAPALIENATSALPSAVDEVIRSNDNVKADALVANAIAERVAGLLGISQQSVDLQRSVAAYGVDSLIAVELRNWFMLAFNTTVSLLKLLDEGISIQMLGSMIVESRKSVMDGSEQ